MRCFIVLLIMVSSLPAFAQMVNMSGRPYDYYTAHSPYYNNYYAQERRFRQPYYAGRYAGNYYETQRPSPLQSLKNYFTGQLTGFTPQINDNIFTPDNYSYAPSDYGTQRYEQYSSPWGSGYRANNYNTGSSSGIRILD